MVPLYRQGSMEGQIIPITVLQQIIKQNSTSFARMDLEASPVVALGEGCLAP